MCSCEPQAQRGHCRDHQWQCQGFAGGHRCQRRKRTTLPCPCCVSQPSAVPPPASPAKELRSCSAHWSRLWDCTAFYKYTQHLKMTLLYLISANTRCGKGEGTRSTDSEGTVRCHNLNPSENSRMSSTGWITPGLSLQALVTHQCAQFAAELGLPQAVPEPMPCSGMNAKQLTLLLPQPPQPGCCSPLQLRNPPLSACFPPICT